jgi:hypothetical protein
MNGTARTALTGLVVLATAHGIAASARFAD